MKNIDKILNEKLLECSKKTFLKTITINSINDVYELKNKNIYNCIINNVKINNIRRINKFHEVVNVNLNTGDYYTIFSETLEERRIRVWKNAPLGFRNLLRIIDFTYKRVFPKLPLIKKIYFSITKGHNRVLSKAEILGRLISCGFEIIEYFEFENLFYVISKKKKKPDFNLSPSYSPIFKMKRIGFKGKIIGVYKLRTMYPYSEYLQDFITKKNKLETNGKIANDYRVTTWGGFCRRFWIDEIPMIINFLKGEINIIGVRPLSISYFEQYPEELQKFKLN